MAFASSSSSARYRTAPVSSRQTQQTLNGVGTIEPVAQATVAFPTSGTIASVAVKPGDNVTAGTELASLDQASLEQAVTQAQSNLDQAELTLEQAQNGQAVTSASGANSGATAQPTSYTSDSNDTTTHVVLVAAKNTDQDLAAAQQAVIDAQKQVDEDLAAADQAYATAKQVCGSITSPDSSTTTTSSDQTTSSSTPPSTSSSVGLEQQRRHRLFERTR